MCDIYSRAYLTIAATKSNDPSGGCYTNSDFRAGRTQTFTNANGEQLTLHAREKGQFPHLGRVMAGLPNDDDVHFPLLERAWVFQERILSPRFLHFGPHELLWECISVKLCQCAQWREHYENSMFFEKPYMMLDSIPDTYTRLGGSTDVSLTQWKWRRVVEQYTAEALTDQGDILFALQGVAEFLQRDCSYQAGLWEDNSMLPDLCWHIRDRIQDRDIWKKPGDGVLQDMLGIRPAKWRAPSWSWASVTKPVAFTIQFHVPVKALASIVSVDTELAGRHPYGKIKSGKLVLRGCCFNARIVENTSIIPTLKVGECVPVEPPSHHWNQPVRGFFPDFDISHLLGCTVRVMKILEWQTHYAGSRSQDLFFSYLVFIVEDKAKDTYTRIGYIDVHNVWASRCFPKDAEERNITVV